MDKTIDHVRALAAKNQSLIGDSLRAKKAIVSAAKTELQRVIKQLSDIKEHDAVTNPDVAQSYLDLIHRKASIERLIAKYEYGSSSSRDETISS